MADSPSTPAAVAKTDGGAAPCSACACAGAAAVCASACIAAATEPGSAGGPELEAAADEAAPAPRPAPKKSLIFARRDAPPRCRMRMLSRWPPELQWFLIRLRRPPAAAAGEGYL